jgi:hypothetical protein
VQAAVFQVTSILAAGLVLFMSRGDSDSYDDGYTAFWKFRLDVGDKVTIQHVAVEIAQLLLPWMCLEDWRCDGFNVAWKGVPVSTSIGISPLRNEAQGWWWILVYKVVL